MALAKDDIDVRLTAARSTNGGIPGLRFLVVDVNVWATVRDNSRDPFTVPAEIGVAEFTLKKGIGRVLHASVHPGESKKYI